MKKIELLAPASSFEGLKAVIKAGADAVYLGGKLFGARAYAENFDEETLIHAIQYAHLHKVKVHLTVNTLIKDDEIETLYNYILPYYNAGLDAVIVQDIGAMQFIKKQFPQLEIHMSTQTTITSNECVNIIKEYDIKRIVLSRELCNQEIEEIKRTTGVEVETFIHGALCYSYSGQCLFSSMIGDRSGNRGRCAQPCRKKYQFIKKDGYVSDEKYLLSPKDMCGIENLHNLINIGVDSLKIEGRMKKVEYAATIVSVYRKYIDKFYELGYTKYVKYLKANNDAVQEDILKMKDIYNRGGFTSGYFNRHNGEKMMATNLPSHQGVLVGKIINVSNRQCTILFNKDVNRQDVLFIRNEYNIDEKNSYEFTLKEDYRKNDKFVTNYSKGIKIEVGQLVYRIKNNVLIDEIKHLYIDNSKKVKINFFIQLKKNNKCVIQAYINGEMFEYIFEEVSEAINRPITKENVIKQFSKLSETYFELNKIEVDMDDDIFIPLKVLNEYRRHIIDSIVEKYNNRKNTREYITENVNKIQNEHGQLLQGNNDSYSKNKEYCLLKKTGVLVQNLTQLKVVLEYKEIEKIYLEMDAFKQEDLIKAMSLVTLNNKEIYIALPRIIRNKDIVLIEYNYNKIFSESAIKGYLVRNIEGIGIIKRLKNNSDITIIADSNLYTMNIYAYTSWRAQGVNKITVSTELEQSEMDFLKNKDAQLVIYGRPAVMVSANCIKKTNKLCNLKSENIMLKDSYDENYIVRNVCNYCYNIIYNSKPIYLIDDIVKQKDLFREYRVEFVDEDKNEIRSILDNILSDTITYKNNFRHKSNFKGHFDKKTL